MLSYSSILTSNTLSEGGHAASAAGELFFLALREFITLVLAPARFITAAGDSGSTERPLLHFGAAAQTSSKF